MYPVRNSFRGRSCAGRNVGDLWSTAAVASIVVPRGKDGILSPLGPPASSLGQIRTR